MPRAQPQRRRRARLQGARNDRSRTGPARPDLPVGPAAPRSVRPSADLADRPVDADRPDHAVLGRRRLPLAFHRPDAQLRCGARGDVRLCLHSACAADEVRGACLRGRRRAPRGCRGRRYHGQGRHALARHRRHAHPALGDDAPGGAADARLVLPQARGRDPRARLPRRGVAGDDPGRADHEAARPRHGHAGARRRGLRDLLRRPAVEVDRRARDRRAGDAADRAGR